LGWLTTTDPSPNHNAARELHDAHTGSWFTKSSEYQNWKTGSIRFLWLHGIPGAGKTVLFSYIVEDVKKYCKSWPNDSTACSYYYCSFERARDEVPHLLRWVISQLCRQCNYLPDELQNCFYAKEQPSVPVLTRTLSTILRNFRHVYLLLDALDESVDRRNLLRLLAEVFAGDAFRKIRLLATSREEIDIEIAFRNVCVDVSLSNPFVDKDIQVYIRNQIQEHHKLRTWPESLWVEIEAALVNGAKGMYVIGSSNNLWCSS